LIPRDFFRAKSRANKKIRAKNFFDFLKFHLTHSHEKHNSKPVINFYLHDFAQNVRLEEGVIFNGN